ncbi:MAG: hypothetical protein DSY37_01880 [Hyperthermus sp.]|nr:MAG: hypothetical protein DSY37_01880 [Hyperthermus sp.]
MHAPVEEEGIRVGPVEGWMVRTRSTIGFVKGCLHPLPYLYYVPRVIAGIKLYDEPGITSAVKFAEPELIREDPCLGLRTTLVHIKEAGFTTPWDAARRLLKTCKRRICQTALSLIEQIENANPRVLVGVTGSLAYNPTEAEDIDIVAYSQPSELQDVYRLLAELREEGYLKPYHGEGHQWSSSDKELNLRLSEKRVLLGIVDSFEYNVKLVACLAPARCVRLRRIGETVWRGRVCTSINYTIPSLYVICNGGRRVNMLTYRIRYTEIPAGVDIEVRGWLEEWCSGLKVLVPDHGGHVKLL